MGPAAVFRSQSESITMPCTAAGVGDKALAVGPGCLRLNVHSPASRSPRKLYHAAGLLSLVSVQTLNEDILSAAVLITIICDGCHILGLLYCHKLQSRTEVAEVPEAAMR